MPTKLAFPCAACGTEFGSNRARAEHDKTCPVKRNAELRRIQESLQSQVEDLQRRITLMFGWAARSFANYHAQHLTHARLYHRWIQEDLYQSLRDVESLSHVLQEHSKAYFPYLSKLNREAGLLIEQLKDLSMILETLTSVFGGPEHHA